MKCFFCVILVLEITFNEALPQDFGRILFNLDGSQQNQHRQGSIDEFIALRPSTSKPIDNRPCIPHQYHSRTKRSPIFNKKKYYPVYPAYPAFYPVNIYEQNINNVVPVNSVKPVYNGHGGYPCGNYVQPQPHPIQQPVHNNIWSHFSNLFGGVFGTNTNVIAASPPHSGAFDVKPVHEDNHENHPNEVSRYTYIALNR